MEAYLDDRVLGQRLAVSATLLSREINEPLNHARQTLWKFWNSRKNDLDASFVVSIWDASTSRLVLKLVNATELDSKADHSAEIWAVAPANVTDPVVVAELGRKTRDLEATMDSSTLSTLGGLVSDGMAGPPVSGGLSHSQSSQASQKSRIPQSKLGSKLESNPTPQNPDSTVKSDLMERQTRKEAGNQKIKKEESGQNAVKSRDTHRQSTNAKEVSPKEKTRSPFTSVSKAEAQAFQRKPIQRVAKQSVVAADPGSDDESQSHMEVDPAPEQREEQMRKLGRLFDEPQFPQNTDSDLPQAHLEPQPDAEPEPEDESETSNGESEPEQAVQLDNPDAVSERVEPEIEESIKRPSDDPAAKRFKKVRRMVTTKDDEGYDQVNWEEVLVPVDESPELDSESNPRPSSETQLNSESGPRSKPESELKPKPEPKSNSNSDSKSASKPESTPQIQPRAQETKSRKAKSKDTKAPQKTLYSFFKKK